MTKSIAAWLKHYRKQSGLTLQQVSQKIHLDASTVSKYETGNRTPDPDTISKLATLYGISTDAIMPGAHPMVRDRVFFINQPLINPWPPLTRTLYGVFIVLLLAHGLYGLFAGGVHQALLFMSFGALGALVFKRLYDLAFSKPHPKREYRLSEDEQLVFIHPDEETVLRKARVLDIFVYVVLLFCAIIVGAFYVQFDDELLTAIIITSVMFANLVAMITLALFALLGKTERKRMLYLKTNSTLNTVKYRALEWVTMSTSFLYFIMYPFAVEYFEGSIDVAVFLFLMNYALIAIALITHKRQVVRQYKIHCERR